MNIFDGQICILEDSCNQMIIKEKNIYLREIVSVVAFLVSVFDLSWFVVVVEQETFFV